MINKLKFSSALIFAVILLIQVKINAQVNYIISATNGVLLNDYSYEFDIYILRTGIQPFELASFQVSIYFNNVIMNGGTVTGEYISGTSGLSNSAQYPFTPNLTFSKSGGSIRQFRIAAKIPPGAGSGSIISNTEPGTRFGRFRITSTNPLLKNLPAGWQWNFSTGQGEYASYINAYPGTANTNITNQANFQMNLHDPLSSAVTFQLFVYLQDGWNMVSIPGLHPVDQNVNTWWIDKDPAADVFRFNNGYHPVTSVTPGTGYWMKHLDSRLYNTGDEWPLGINIVPHNPLNAFVGWNLIGVYESPVQTTAITTAPPGLQSGAVFGYFPSTGYAAVSDLYPGYGYWINLTADGNINLYPTLKSTSKTAVYINEDWGRIILTDNAGKSYTLYAVKSDANPEDYQLPPVPPAGMFDVRYGSGRFAEDLRNNMQSVEMNGIEYPVKVKVENMNVKIQDEQGKILYAGLKPGEEFLININKLFISEDVIPEKYSLGQNYPNPFNPATKIKFTVPNVIASETKQSQLVTLKIYDVLGNDVTTLVNEEKEPGIYEVSFDASNYASGIYFYSISAGGFKQTKKMVLAK